MKRIVAGIAAHVDSGKTTLSEAVLYTAGKIKKMGRVDHGDSFLDTDSLERERGITVFSKQAQINIGDTEITLIDTPGHIDFSAETERTFTVLDYAILVISGSDGVTNHTKTLWNLLKHYRVPVFIFVNKMDMVSADKDKNYSEIRSMLSENCVDFSCTDAELYENVASCSETLMKEYFEKGRLSDSNVADAIAAGNIFPCYFGSALKNDGVREFLDGFSKYTVQPEAKEDFGAKVYKISEDSKGMRLTHLKITGGSLRVKDVLKKGTASSKVNEIRVYSGSGYVCPSEVFAGEVCTVTGLDDTYSGEGFGFEADDSALVCEPMFSYSVRLPEGMDTAQALPIFKKLSEEETQLDVSLDTYSNKINVRVMGDIQLEILKRVLEDRFGLCVEFESGSVIYKETIANAVVGVGHYEPLRHYCEVQLLLEPAPHGSGIIIKSKCSEDVLSKNWQRLIFTHITEKTHVGVLTGSPITDVKITLISGRAHEKHTEGGDFRQATYRAIRQGLMQAESVLLEPWVKFDIELPSQYIGKVLTDLKMMNAEFGAPESDGENSRITGSAPISEMSDYGRKLIGFTKGKSKIGIVFDAYKPCVHPDEVISEKGYNPETDIENTPDSVFCSRGSGYNVKWNEVFEHMHLQLYDLHKNDEIEIPAVKRKKYDSLIANEEELLKIFENTYGKIQRRSTNKLKTETYIRKKTPKKSNVKTDFEILPEYLLIDGYNIIFAVDSLKEISADNPDAARNLLITRLCNYAAIKNNNVILVFDAYKVKGAVREIEHINNICVVYTKEAETADTYIEKTSTELAKKYRVRVATSDAQEQMIVFGSGALRVSAKEFYRELCDAEDEMRRYINEI